MSIYRYDIFFQRIPYKDRQICRKIPKTERMKRRTDVVLFYSTFDWRYITFEGITILRILKIRNIRRVSKLCSTTAHFPFSRLSSSFSKTNCHSNTISAQQHTANIAKRSTDAANVRKFRDGSPSPTRE